MAPGKISCKPTGSPSLNNVLELNTHNIEIPTNNLIRELTHTKLKFRK